MYLWCVFWWLDDFYVSVAVALGDFRGPVTTERDTVMLAEVGLGKECMDGVQVICRVPDLRHGYAIAPSCTSASPFAVKCVTKKKRIVTRIITSFRCLLEA